MWPVNGNDMLQTVDCKSIEQKQIAQSIIQKNFPDNSVFDAIN